VRGAARKGGPYREGIAFEEEMIRSAEVTEVGGIRLPVPRPEDLLVMKAIANRPRDRVDIESLVSAYPELDREKVLSRVREKCLQNRPLGSRTEFSGPTGRKQCATR